MIWNNWDFKAHIFLIEDNMFKNISIGITSSNGRYRYAFNLNINISRRDVQIGIMRNVDISGRFFFDFDNVVDTFLNNNILLDLIRWVDRNLIKRILIFF